MVVASKMAWNCGRDVFSEGPLWRPFGCCSLRICEIVMQISRSSRPKKSLWLRCVPKTRIGISCLYTSIGERFLIQVSKGKFTWIRTHSIFMAPNPDAHSPFVPFPTATPQWHDTLCLRLSHHCVVPHVRQCSKVWVPGHCLVTLCTPFFCWENRYLQFRHPQNDCKRIRCIKRNYNHIDVVLEY